MTVIRLTRMGRKKKPFYRIVVTDSRKRRDGGWIESIGYYNPVSENKELKVDEERLNYWISVGAQMNVIDENLTELILYVNSEDIGRVIGKDGRMISSIKTIISGCKPKGGPSYKVSVKTKDNE